MLVAGSPVPEAALDLRSEAPAAHPHSVREPVAGVRRGEAAGGLLVQLRSWHLHPNAVRAPGTAAGMRRSHAGAAPTLPECMQGKEYTLSMLFPTRNAESEVHHSFAKDEYPWSIGEVL